MIKYTWKQYSGYIEIEGTEESNFTKTLASEARLVLNEKDSSATLIWIYVSKEKQNKGYGKDILREIKENIRNFSAHKIEKINFKQVTSIGMMNLINKIFLEVKIDFSHLPKEIATARELEFQGNPWIPKLSPAKYSKNGGCTINKNAPGVSMTTML